MDERVLHCVYDAIDEANQDRSDAPPLEKSPNTQIHGSGDGLDSLGLINFVVAVEEGIELDLGKTILLSDDRAMSREPSPFESVRELVGYIEELLDEV